jgi:hypothetical protein
MSNDEGMTNPEYRKQNVELPHSSTCELNSSFGIRHLSSPALPRVTYRRQTFSKVRLLALGFSLLIRLAHLLFRAGTWGGTA